MIVFFIFFLLVFLLYKQSLRGLACQDKFSITWLTPFAKDILIFLFYLLTPIGLFLLLSLVFARSYLSPEYDIYDLSKFAFDFYGPNILLGMSAGLCFGYWLDIQQFIISLREEPGSYGNYKQELRQYTKQS